MKKMDVYTMIKKRRQHINYAPASNSPTEFFFKVHLGLASSRQEDSRDSEGLVILVPPDEEHFTRMPQAAFLSKTASWYRVMSSSLSHLISPDV